MPPVHVFISYSRRDTSFVERLEAALNARGIATWRDSTSIPGGEDWYQNIIAGLANAYAVICIVTPHADDSKWVKREQLRADEDNIHPLVVQPAKHRNPLHLQEVQPILMDEMNFNAGLLALVAALERCRSSGHAPAVPAPQDDSAGVQEYLKWVLSDAKADLYDDLYIELEVAQERQQALTFGMEDDFAKAWADVPDARQAIRNLRRAVLLGEPGAGKTTILLKLTVDLARAAQTDPTARLPLVIPLREFDGAIPFADFIRAKAHNLQTAFDRLRGRWMLLCDALNEMPRAAHSDGRDLMAEVRLTLEAEPDWVVSCRVNDYTDDLNTIAGIGKIRLKPLDPSRIQTFIQRRYASWGEPERGAALWRELRGSDDLLNVWAAFAAEGVPEGFWGEEWLLATLDSWSDEALAWWWLRDDHRRLLTLCRSPFMANMVCALYRRDDRLPESRSGLYASFVTYLLRAEEKRRAETGLAWMGEAPVRSGLGAVAWAMGTQTEMERDAAEAILRQQVPDQEPVVVLGAAASAGLIDYRARVRFTHQFLQQYFAAALLGALLDAQADPAAIWPPERWWQATGREETAIVLAGDRNNPLAVARWLAPAQPQLALELLEQPDFALDVRHLDPAVHAVLVAAAQDKAQEPNPVGRAAAYRVLGRLDADTRPGVGLREDGLPDIAWSEVIPAGEFIMGSDEGYDAEKPRRTVRIEQPYQIARYPVTYRQYQAFIDAVDGWNDPRWWEGLAAGAEHKAQPDEQMFRFWNHPREVVSWYDALAFCRWLSFRLGGGYALDQVGEWVVRLPTEQEWERAARGTDGRLYPYGNTFDATKGNTAEMGIGQTSAVGIFPDGVSPAGALDMSGNVWEWCLTDWLNPAGENLSSDARRVVRGGSWFNDQNFARSAFRGDNFPLYRTGLNGFRVSRSLHNL